MSKLICVVAAFAGPLAAAGLSSTTTFAQSAQQGQWQMTVGAGVRMQPSYEGSDRFSIAFRPIISFGRAGAVRWWSAEDDAISIGLVNGGNWRAGVGAAIVPSRSGKDQRRLNGLEKIPFGVEIGGFGEYYPTQWLRARADLRQAIRGHQGLVGELKLDAFTDPNAQWSFGAGPRLTVVNTRYVDSYFSVSPAEAAASGYPVYQGKGGVHSVGALAQASYRWTPAVKSTAYVKYDYLTGGASKAPVVVSPLGSRHQLELGFSTSWSFDLSR
jgi:outer membrane scaffolding protein for murein synthesis (MipA/OmpV family)